MFDRIYKSAQIISALATAVLAVLTFSVVRLNSRYVALTNQLVLQQQTPDVELAFPPPALADKVLIHNAGPQPVVDVKIWWTAYLHDAKGSTISTLFYSQPSAASPQSWWEIPRLKVGQQETKEISDVISNIGHNIDVMEQSLKRRGFQSARLMFTCQYRREVDQKMYSFYLGGKLVKDSQTGKYFLEFIPVTPEPTHQPGN